MSEALAVRQDATLAFEPNGIEEAYRLSKILVASNLLPKSIATPEAAFTIIATGRELGLTAMQALRSIHVIEGKPTLSADLMLALVKRSAECEYFRLVESNATKATYETKRRGEPEPTRMSFTIEQAKLAGVLGKGNWQKFPDAMLRARAITALARAVYPDTCMGLYDAEELEPARPSAIRVVAVEPDLSEKLRASIAAAKTEVELRGAIRDQLIEALKPEGKASMTAEQVESLKKTYLAREQELTAGVANGNSAA